MNNIKTMTSEYGIACKNGIEASARAEIARKRCKGAFVCENTSSEQEFVPGGNGNGLLPKTNNTFGADFSRFGWSDGVSGSDGGAFGSNLVRMVLSRFPLAAGIRTACFDFTSNLAFVPRFGGQFAVASAVE